MFANRKKTPAIQLSKLSSLIAEDVVIVGDISFSAACASTAASRATSSPCRAPRADRAACSCSPTRVRSRAASAAATR
jgi:hypothetical protein